MAFHHLAGVTTLGAANAVDDWFITFEAWIRDTVGWTIAAGTGTDDLRISSIGESGLMTLLFAHIWRTPGTEDVRTEVSDDVIPTHETTRGGPDLQSNSARFAYWMSADLDSIVIVWKSGTGYWMRYAGLVMPFAQNAPDETYYMLSTNGIRFSTILRRFDGVWDRDDSLYENDYLYESGPDRDVFNAPLGGTYHGDMTEIAGQLKHVSCRIKDTFSDSFHQPEDVITSNDPAATSTWIVLGDATRYTFALRTGGQMPFGPPETNFAYATGNAGAMPVWIGTTVAFMAFNGWALWDISGLTGNMFDFEFNSTGETGTDDIWVRLFTGGVGPRIFVSVADSAWGTPGRHEATPVEMQSWVPGIFPTLYHYAGDGDCVLMTIDDGAWYVPCWAGKVYPAIHGLSSASFMNVMAGNMDGVGLTTRQLLLGHDGTWNAPLDWNWRADGNSSANCNPSAYDAVTYFVWQQMATRNRTGGLGGRQEPVGVMKYFYSTEGGGVANLDTIADGAEVFTIFSAWYGGAGRFWCMRTDVLGGGVNFPGRRLYPNDGNTNISPIIDSGPITKGTPTALERGDTAADFNVLVRGHATRIDIIPGL